jgi:hypothetical protein
MFYKNQKIKSENNHVTVKLIDNVCQKIAVFSESTQISLIYDKFERLIISKKNQPVFKTSRPKFLNYFLRLI